MNKESPITSLNENEKNVYELVKNNGDCKINFLLENVNMTRAGLKSLLKRMAMVGHIRVKGKGKGTIYFV